MKALPLRGAVFLDLDGTTLRPDHSVAPVVRSAVQRLRESGVAVVLCSSRSPAGIGLVQDQLDTRGDLMVAYQGAMVCAWKDDELVVHHEATISDDALTTLEEVAALHELSLSAYAGLDWRCLDHDATNARAARITHEHPRVVDTLLDTSAPPHKVLAIASGPEFMSGLAAMEDSMPDLVTASRSHPDYLEITTHDVDKGTGVIAACSILGISPDQTAAAGDGYNDVPMFAAVGHRIAMGQAPQAVQDAADIVIGDNTTDDLAAHLLELGRHLNQSRSTIR